jgi:flagellar FliL protein
MRWKASIRPVWQFQPGKICRPERKSKAFVNQARAMSCHGDGGLGLTLSFIADHRQSDRQIMAKKSAKSDDAPEGDGASGGIKGKIGGLFGNKKVLIGAVVAVLALGGGAGYFFLKGKKADDQTVAGASGAGGDQRPAGQSGPKKPSAFLDLPEMTVNLAAGGGQLDRQQFLRMKIALEVGEQKVVTEIQPMLPRVMDTFQVFMRELRPQDLEGSAGLYRLKEEMTRRVNVAVYPARVDAILFKELMVQ